MGYLHSKEQILEAAVAVALERGLAGLTFRTVGDRLGIRDRTVVYYFPTKPELAIAVIAALSEELRRILGAAFGDTPRTKAELLSSAWPVLTTPTAERMFALMFEMTGLAVSGQEPYAQLARLQFDAWVDWLSHRTLGSDVQSRRAAALATVATVDGLLLLRQMLGADASDAALSDLLGTTS